MILEQQLKQLLQISGIKIKGVIHIGAHDCQELPIYRSMEIEDNNIIWIDAIPWKIEQAKSRGINNIYNLVISEKDDEDVVFNVTNNEQSSSILELGTHSTAYPEIFYVSKINKKTTKLDTFYDKENLDKEKYNFWNIDVQGAELLVLKGAKNHLPFVDILYLEINQDELYVNCGLVHEIDSFLTEFGFQKIVNYIIPDKNWGEAIYINVNKFNLQKNTT